MLIDSSTLLLFAGASLATYIAPGADMAYLASQAMPNGTRAGLTAGVGILIGIVIQALAAAFGVTAIFAASPLAFSMVKWVGVVYLLYLGIKVLRSGAVALGTSRGGSDWQAGPVIAKGIGINLLNPKISLFFFAFLPQFVEVAKGRVFEQLLLLGSLFAAGSVVWLSLLAVIFARVGGAIAGSAVAQAWQRRMTGGVLIGYAGALALSGLRR